MVCKKCGEEIPDNSKFCLSCGEKIDIKILEDEPVNTQNKSPSNNPRILVIVGVIITIVLAAMVVIVSFFSRGREPANQPSTTSMKQQSIVIRNDQDTVTTIRNEELDSREVSDFLTEYIKNKLFKVSFGNASTTNSSGDQDIFVSLNYNASNTGKQTKTMLLYYSDQLATSILDRFPITHSITFTWAVPSFDASILLTYETTGKKSMRLTNEILDPVFDSDLQPSTNTQVANNTTTEPSSAESVTTIGQSNALKKALSYLKSSAFSRPRLIDQLKYEGFSDDESLYAVDHCGANWKEQAAKKAQSYLEHSAFSKSGLLDQLLYEGFSQEEAEYGVAAVGY